jgi:hypothetical protein
MDHSAEPCRGHHTSGIPGHLGCNVGLNPMQNNHVMGIWWGYNGTIQWSYRIQLTNHMIFGRVCKWEVGLPLMQMFMGIMNDDDWPIVDAMGYPISRQTHVNVDKSRHQGGSLHYIKTMKKLLGNHASHLGFLMFMPSWSACLQQGNASM